MFVRKMSGTIVRAEFSPGQEPVELDRIDGLDHEPTEDELDAAQARYEAFLGSRDFSGGGDLLPFFARDFFHDSSRERRALSPEMALRLSQSFGNSPEFWLNAQRAVDLWDAAQELKRKGAHIKRLSVA